MQQVGKTNYKLTKEECKLLSKAYNLINQIEDEFMMCDSDEIEVECADNLVDFGWFIYDLALCADHVSTMVKRENE